MTQTPIKTTTNLAAEYVAIRWEIQKCEARRRELEPLVAEWGKEQITEDKGNKKTVYVCPDSKAQLVLKSVVDNDFIKKHPDVQCLDELIQIEEETARYQNKEAIAILERQLKLLAQQLALLSETVEGVQLKAEREELMNKLKSDPKYLKKQVAFQVGF